jgi:hypothetical protein
VAINWGKIKILIEGKYFKISNIKIVMFVILGLTLQGCSDTKLTRDQKLHMLRAAILVDAGVTCAFLGKYSDSINTPWNWTRSLDAARELNKHLIDIGASQPSMRDGGLGKTWHE